MLGYSQSAVTVQIRLLENELETKLFDRMGKKISLTPQGTQFYEHCNRILYELEWIMLSMKTNQELKNSLHNFAVEKYIQNGDLAMLDIKEIEISMYRQIFYHKDKFCTREMKEFIRLVKESENDHSLVM